MASFLPNLLLVGLAQKPPRRFDFLKIQFHLILSWKKGLGIDMARRKNPDINK